jgi:autotransporter-associated beta strand protein
MNTPPVKISLACLALLAGPGCLHAATIIKTNNTDNLNLTTSWIGGVVPGPLDVAKWDTNVTSANAVALGADTTWTGIIITNTGGPVTINAGNTLTLGVNGIDMSRASQNLTISSGLTLLGMQRWNVTNGMTLTVNGTLARSGNAGLVVGASTGATNLGVVTASPALENGLVPWASVQIIGAATNGLPTGYNFATVSGGNLVPYTNATLEATAGSGVSFGGIPTGDNSTVNYDLGIVSTGGVMNADTYVNTLRNIGGTYLQNGSGNFRANAIMNSGTGVLTISTPVQQADTSLNELVIAAWTQGITLSNVISDNGNPLAVTFTGTNNQSILLAGQNTFSGPVNINGARVGIRANSIPQSGALTSGPLSTNPITLTAGGILFASSANNINGNPIVVGPGGGALQFASASPDLTINGNVTGSGPLTMAGVFNVNGLFLNGDDSAYNGIMTVSGSNNRLGNTNSGSALARWVVNGALQAQLVGGGTYYLGELSSTATTGGLCGHAGNLTPAVQNFVVGALNTSSTYSGCMSNNASNNQPTGNSDAAANNVVALTKVGTGTLTLTGPCNNTGQTTISGGAVQLGNGGTTGTLSANGTIQVDGTLIINHSNPMTQGVNFSSSGITGNGSFVQAGTGATTLTAVNTYTNNTLVSAGSLFVNGSIVGTATVLSGAKLGGNGTIGDVVTVQAGGQLGAGATATNIGTLTLNVTPVLGGTVLAKINAGTAQADQIVVAGGNPINYGGTLVVTNVGVPLLAGDTFTIFTAAAHNGSFSSIVGNPGPNLAYSFANGVLSVVSTIASNPTNVTATLSTDVTGTSNTVTLAWPSDHLGWLLQSQTNDADGSIVADPTAWHDLAGSASVNLLSITNPTDLAIYFRMRYVNPPAPSGAPTGLTAKPTNSAVALSWTAPGNARSYNVKNSTTSGGPYTTVANVITTSYTNTGLINGTPYYFVVSALNYNGESTNSVEVTATPIAVPPLAPTGLAALAAHGEVLLTWTAAVGATNHNVKRATVSGGPYTIIASTPVTNYLDTTVVDGTTYYYVVSGVNIDGESTNSAEVNATPQAVPPTVPIGVTATGQYLQARVSWTASFGSTSYNVKVSTVNGGPYTTFTNTTSTTVYDPGLTAGTPYYFVVSALNAIGESADSSQATATPTNGLPNYYDFENTGLGYPAPPLPALGDPSLPYIQPLPDPYYWASDPFNINGTGSTNFSDWSHHRAEISAQVQNYEIGIKPYVDPTNMTVSVSGTGTSRTLSVIVTNVVSGTNRTIALSFPISLPSASGTFPAIIGMNSQAGSVNSSLLTTVAKITYSVNQVTVYGAQQGTDPYYQFYASPSVPALDTFNTGQYSAWAWGCSRIIDGLYKLKGNLGGGVQLDLSHIAVTGCSYAGKMALFCGALDERVALTIAQESGGGGAPVWRYSATEPPGSVEWLPNTDHNWFSEGMFAFGNGTNVGFLPEDHHELMAMVAPRALFATDNPDFVWLSNPSAYVSCKATEQVYTGFGISDRFGYNIVGGHNHCSTTTTIDSEMGAFINKFLLGQTNANTLIRDVDPNIVNTVDFARWTVWWGSTNAILP